MNEDAAAPFPDPLRDALAHALYAHDRAGLPDRPAWDDEALDVAEPGLRERYLGCIDALAAGPLARILADAAGRSADEEELRVLRRQRMAPERERELLEANNRLLSRVEAAEAAQDIAEAALARMQRERDVAREAEAFWQQFAFDADDLATRRLLEQNEARAAAERDAIRERCQRERAEAALRLFADRAEVMPKEGWASELSKANRDIPLWWFHAARVALEPPDSVSDPAGENR
ncbi:hypothetical protein SAMN05216360_106261 [Methylobacterium phyllostachyos]|uniref:Uncharacterized protein n=1 Tax=Methylobacterium phyllostachyos TaxID=582672 RepID=A0A1G9ZGH6_9HYPH|nr:hypothetical protein [Methylobacterium phyllostachyos]SDN20354.1 hypothetical protein SAMN05216360_106261 [Methylobacterium phyllostachyos]